MGCGAGGAGPCNWGNPWIDTDNNTLYMAALPQDPAANQNYYYYQVDNNSYYLFARLENELDADVAVDLSEEPTYYDGYFCDGVGTLGCNYVVLSTNIINKPPTY